LDFCSTSYIVSFKSSLKKNSITSISKTEDTLKIILRNLFISVTWHSTIQSTFRNDRFETVSRTQQLFADLQHIIPNFFYWRKLMLFQFGSSRESPFVYGKRNIFCLKILRHDVLEYDDKVKSLIREYIIRPFFQKRNLKGITSKNQNENWGK